MKTSNAEAYARPFITIDLPLPRDGEWRVVAVGDGQVSDLPALSVPGQLIAQLS